MLCDAKCNIRYLPYPWYRINPFRYRCYYFDSESGFYYLNSRYYDPAIGRFISPDSYINANGDLLGFNMYAYCGNNPVIFADYSGKSVILVIGGIAITEKVMSALFATVSVAVIGIYAISQTQVNSSQTPSISFPQAPSSESKYTVLNKEIDAGKENTKGFYRHYHPEPRNGGHVYFLLP